MTFAVSGLPLESFQPLFGLSDEELARRGVRRYVVDKPVGYPCRVKLVDALPGETVLLLNYEHLPQDTPYRSSHAIFVCEQATETRRVVDEVPPVLAIRPSLSLRAFDEGGMMLDAEVAPGAELRPAIERLLGLPGVACLHAHNAARGCYVARIDRA